MSLSCRFPRCSFRAFAKWKRPSLAVAFAAVAAGSALTLAFGASLGVEPTTIMLGSRSPSQLLTVRNLGQEEVRMELSAFAWRQKRDGQTVLTPTNDIVFFPPLLEIAPQGESKIRVGAVVSPGAAEKTYRLILQELPKLDKRTKNFQIQLLTRESLPIFLEPSTTTVSAQIKALSFGNGVFSFAIRNTGTQHFIAQTVQVSGLDTAGKQVFSRETKGWYILAEGARDYRFPIDAHECAQSCRLVIAVKTPGHTFRKDYTLPLARCATSSQAKGTETQRAARVPARKAVPPP